MGDATRRTLKLPPWHVPYLEKYRIMELFRELSRELIVHQPVDHLLFLKQIIANAASSRNVPRLILLGSPKVNSFEVAKQISHETNQFVIDEQLILKTLNLEKREEMPKEKFVGAINNLIRNEKVQQAGWILVDCIKTSDQARRVMEAGIIPTHVIHLIPQFNPPLNELLYCHVNQGWAAYRRSIMGIREILKKRLVELQLGTRTLYDVVNMCVQIMTIRDDPAPLNLRVLLIGPRGSGRKTQAKLLEKELKLVYIDFEYLLCQAWNSRSEVGKRLRSFQDEACFQSDLLVQVLSERVLQDDCMERGWVLTGFPYTLQDFKHLDTIDTPPNRVVILELDLNICKERLMNRRLSACTGSVTNVAEDPESLTNKKLHLHPKDRRGPVEAELTYYCEHYGAIRNYCGGTATVVNANQSIRWVYENVCAILTRGSPACPPRQPCIVKEDKEWDALTGTCSSSTSTVTV